MRLTLEDILENLKKYKFEFERTFLKAIRYEKMGLSSKYITTKQLVDDHKKSYFNLENGLHNFIEHIENRVNLIISLYEISSAQR